MLMIVPVIYGIIAPCAIPVSELERKTVMAKLSFTQENMPTSSEEFRRLLDEAIEKSNPVDDLLEIAVDLAGFEKKYDMPSAEFYQKFQAGQMGDDMDFFRWSGLYRMFVDLRRSIERALMRAAIQKDVEAVNGVPVEQSEMIPA